MKNRQEKLIPNGIPRYIRCYDNTGKTADRYTAIFTGRYTHKTSGQHWILGMNAYPFSPQGIGMHCSYNFMVDAPSGWAPTIGRNCHLGRRINFQDLPLDCQKAVIQDYVYLWDLE